MLAESWITLLTKKSIFLSGHGIQLAPLTESHISGLIEAVSDGNIWQLPYGSAPEPQSVADYIQTAYSSDRIPFAVINQSNNRIIGSTSYYNIVPEAKRLEIGYTWYGKSIWGSHINTACKLLLLSYAFDTLGSQTVGWRADSLNLRSLNAIEKLGAKKDGVIRGLQVRKDGSIRDTVMYSMTAAEWPAAQEKLLIRLNQKQHSLSPSHHTHIAPHE